MSTLVIIAGAILCLSPLAFALGVVAVAEGWRTALGLLAGTLAIVGVVYVGSALIEAGLA